MKKIAIIIQNLNGGGAERTAANLSLYFSEKYEVHLIVFDGRIISYPHGGMLHDLKVYPSKSKVQNFQRKNYTMIWTQNSVWKLSFYPQSCLTNSLCLTLPSN